MTSIFKKTALKSSISLIFAVLLITSCETQTAKKDIQVSSPDKNVQATIDVKNGLQYAVVFNNDTIIEQSAIDLDLKEFGTLSNFEVVNSTTNTVDDTWSRVWGKRKKVKNNYNELHIQLKEQASSILVDLYVRAYNDGIGIRYGFPEQEKMKSFELAKEKTQFKFTEDHTVWRADYQTYKSSQETEFLNAKLSDIKPSQLIGMPLLVQAKDKAYAVITEANLTDWSGAFLRSTDSLKNTMVTELAPLPNDTLIAVKRNTPAVSPWRVVMLAENPGELVESDIIQNLNDPIAIEDASWIQPGVSAWDWWWSNKYAPSANFELGPNQETMKYFIDFAAEMGWEYQIVDWQWYGEPFDETGGRSNPNVDITTPIEGINIEELVKYANSKNVKIIVWGHWESLKNQLDEALATYEKWGVSGIKIDFMDRQDQEMVNYYHTVVKKAAEHHLVVDFHGAYKPTGFSRTYPNLITREGVMGNEYSKWSDRVTPEHNVTLPFTRGLLGEMDYTPVAFRNVTPENFVLESDAADHSPMVQSTRCHQLAMPVVYESAFGVFCDSPDNYRKGIGLEFLQAVPTTWDESKVLNAAVGDYITVARKSGDTWFIGSMTDATERELNIDLSFLEDGNYKVILFQDDEDANEYPDHAVRKVLTVKNTDQLNVKLAQGGGFAAILKKM
ncbi:glycoside hydrolase family 97 protein [Chondrinema litorale]|uniref:glycoside hydrolase family 97 protein n=1 Tax=Chondrinema litorale TaxID=2994555 RepID=UPI0025434C9D|nr:glycoside hydrolase family 97 protein [Chondrinema litorale]UZR97504.1 glycoside hydrolase family 97 protein [Chondrinema litorale]